MDFLRDISKYIKNGAPIAEVIIPTGISAGLIIILATVSAKIKNMAPPNIDAGSKMR